MIFADLIFLYLFLPANLLLYYLSGSRGWRNGILVVFSLLFYAWGEPVYLLLLLFSVGLNYLYGRVIELLRGTPQAGLALAVILFIDLGLLGVFKYSGLAVETVNSLLGLSIPVPGLSLPIGISFYTFQIISYIIDVYRGECPAQRSFSKFLLFVSLYHQLVAGPIVRYTEIAERIDSRTESWNGIARGFDRFFIGLLKKVAIANTAGKLAAPYLDGPSGSLTVLGGWFGALLFSLQIYYDFSGYSDMAIGLGEMFGFSHPENFDYPYASRSATEFWRRWHMTLGRFFRDYLYIPLGGNRRRMVLNLMLTWFATGLWHGASWNFVLWGLYYGVLILLERLFLGKLLERLPRLISHCYLLLAVLFGWILFYFTSLDRAAAYMGRMLGFGGAPLCDLPTLVDLANNCFWLLLAILFCMPVARWFGNQIRNLPEAGQTAVLRVRPALNLLLLALCTALLAGQSYNPFLYFRF